MNEHIRDEERLRQMLDDAVSDVEPRHTLREIRDRTATRSRHGWMWVAGAAAVATAATVTAVVVFGGGPGTTGAQRPGFADGSPTDRATSEQPVTRSAGLPVYYVGDTGRGPRLFREFFSPIDRVGTTEAEFAVSMAVSESPADPDYRTDWPALTFANVEIDGDMLTVSFGGDPESDLRERALGMSPAEARLAVQQLVYTAQAAVDEPAPVRFLLFGETTDRLLGIPIAETRSADDPSEVLAQVWIDKPAEGQIVQREFEVSGLANAFEATVQWELMQGAEVVKRGFTTAEECCTMAPYSFMVTAPPGDYTLVVHDSDPSGGEGFPPWEDTKQITVE